MGRGVAPWLAAEDAAAAITQQLMGQFEPETTLGQVSDV
jgi:hypothetical protein